MVNIDPDQFPEGGCKVGVSKRVSEETISGPGILARPQIVDAVGVPEKFLSVTVDGSTGSINILLDGQEITTFTVEQVSELVVNVTIGDYRSDLQSILSTAKSEVKDELNVGIGGAIPFALKQNLPDRPDEVIPQSIRDGKTIRIPGANFEEEGTIGVLQMDWERRMGFSFGNATIPVPEGSKVQQKLRENGVEINVSTRITGETILGRDIDSLDMSLKVPFCMFIDTETIGDVSCETLTSGIRDEIKKWKSRVNPKLAAAESAVKDLLDKRRAILQISDQPVGDLSIGDLCPGPSAFQNIDAPEFNISSLETDGGRELLREATFGAIEVRDKNRLAKLKKEVDRINTDFRPGGRSFSGLKNEIESLRDKIPSGLRIDCANPLKGLVNELEGLVGQLECLHEEASRLKDDLLSAVPSSISVKDCISANPDIGKDVERFQNEVSQLSFNPDKSTITNLQAEREELLDRIPDEVGGDCMDELRQRVSGAAADLPGPDEIDAGEARETARETRDRVTDCAKAVGGGIRRSVSAFENDVAAFNTRSVKNREQAKKQRMIRRGEKLLSRISSIGAPSRCTSGLRSRVSSAMRDLRNIESRQTAALSCRDKYPDISSDVEALEDLSTSLKPPISNQTIQNIATQAEGLIDEINSEVPPGSSCREEFTNRAASSLDTVRESKTSITVISAGLTGREAEQEETISGIQEETKRRVRVLQSKFEQL